MFELSLENPAEAADVAQASHPRRCAPCAPASGALRPDDVAHFIRDPLAFASRAGAPTPEAFVQAYLEGLERRLSATVGAPRGNGLRLATFSAQSLPMGDLVETAVGTREGAGELDRSPRMGPVIVACAVVQAAASVVAAGAAIYTAMSKHSQR